MSAIPRPPSSFALPMAPHGRLPLELYRSILRESTSETLATCCRVSQVSLELASELLYQHVTIRGLDALGTMFNVPVRPFERLFIHGTPLTSPPRVNPGGSTRKTHPGFPLLPPNHHFHLC